MRKQVLAISLGLLTLGSFAQKKELKSIEKALKNNDFTGALTIVNSLNESIESADDKYKSKYYFLKGQAFAGKKEYQKAADAFNKLFDFEKKIGKERYSAEARPRLDKLIQSVSEKAIGLYNNDKNYKDASKFFYLTYKLSPKRYSFCL
jgi:tetratricopeptide (TPR) repeat protein